MGLRFGMMVLGFMVVVLEFEVAVLGFVRWFWGSWWSFGGLGDGFRVWDGGLGGWMVVLVFRVVILGFGW